MSATLKQKNVWDYIADLNQRLNRLETGGKPLITNNVPDIPDEIPVDFTLPAGVSATITATLSWNDANVTANPNGKIYFSFYVDQDNDGAHYWPSGANIDPSKHDIRWWYDFTENHNVDFKETTVQIFVQNNDNTQHTYYFYDAFSLFSGQSGAGGA